MHPSHSLPAIAEPAEFTAPDTTTTALETTTAPAAQIEPQVLMYHLIQDQVYGDYPYLFVRPDDFAAQLEALNAAGYRYLFADEYAAQPDRTIILTFDDGYADNYTTLLPLLKQYNARATIFLITDVIGADGHLTAEQITEMAQSGYVRFGLHTASHVDLRSLDTDRIRAELSRSHDAFTDLLGQSPAALAYPYGGYNAEVTAISADYVRFAYTTDWPGKVKCTAMAIPRYTVPRGMTSTEFCTMLGITR